MFSKDIFFFVMTSKEDSGFYKLSDFYKLLFIYYVILFWPILDPHPPLCHTAS